MVILNIDGSNVTTEPVEAPPVNSQTLGERIADIQATQDLLGFPAGTATHARAGETLLISRPALAIHMLAEDVRVAATKTAIANLDQYGDVVVTTIEVPS